MEDWAANLPTAVWGEVRPQVGWAKVSSSRIGSRRTSLSERGLLKVMLSSIAEPKVALAGASVRLAMSGGALEYSGGVILASMRAIAKRSTTVIVCGAV